MKNNKRKIKKEILVLSIIFILLLSYIPTFNNLLLKSLEFKNKTDLKPSDTNTLFNGKSYPFELNDVYDDEDYTKIYTDAYLQTEHFDDDTLAWNGTVFDDQVPVVNNSEHTHPEPSDINMVKGAYDNTDNMKSINSVYSDFDSEGYGDYPGTYSFDDDDVGSNPAGFTITESGSNTINVIAESHGHNKVVEFHDVDADVKIQNYFTAKTTGTVEWYMKASQINCRNWAIFYPESGNYLFFAGFYSEGTIRYYDGAYVYVCDYAINTWYHFKFEFNSNTKLFSFYLDGVLITGGDEPYVNSDGTDDIASILWSTSNGVGYMFVDSIGMDWDPNYNVGDNEDGDGKLDFTIESSLSMYNDPDLLSLSITSYHGTDVSTPITVSVWNYDTESYEQMWSTTSTSVVENSHSITSNVINYFSGSGVMKIKYSGAYSSSDFQLNIDYIEFRITYKMDLIIYKIIYENGIWRYRFKLIGSLYYTDWTVFEVIDPEPNFYAISESELTTRWILQGSDISAFEDFHDDISGSNWNLYDVSEDSFYASPSSSYLLDNTTGSNEWDYMNIHFDVGAQDTIPVGITWDGSYFWVLGDNNEEVYKYTSTGVYTGTHFDTGAQDTYQRDIVWDGTYFWVIGGISAMAYKYTSAGVYTGTYIDAGLEDSAPLGITWDGTYYWITGGINDRVYKYTSAGTYTGTSFYVGSQDGFPLGITWDGTYFWVLGSINKEVFKYTSAGTYTGTSFYVGTEDSSPKGIDWDGTHFWVIGDGADEAYKYENILDVSKIYQGSGYMYIQTDETELISLNSGDYGAHKTLNSGDYFEIDFQTSSDSQINLILLKDGGVNKTLTLSQSGNTNFNRHTVQISTNELVEFDQLRISGTLEDVDYAKVYDIKTYKYTLTGDYTDFYVGSKRTEKIYLTPDVYNLRIEDYSSGLNLVNENITIPATGVKQYVYTPIATKQCRITFFNPQNVPLAFTDYHVYVNRSLGGSYNPFTLLENIFSVDVDTTVYIEIKDRFNTLIRNYEKLITPTTDYLDIELEVYSLQIKNLMTQKTTLTINNTLYDYPLLSGDSIYFTLSEAHYLIGYYDTNNVDKEFTIYLNSNQAYELNRSKICFLSYADQQGNHLYFENYKTYLNGSLLYENMFYREIGDNIGIEIKDRYNISIKNETYTVISGDNYIPITLTMYSLKIMNQQEIFNWINITRDPNYYESSMYWSEWIAPNEIIEFNLFAGYYKINLTDNENSGSSYYSYTLNGDDVLLISSGNTISNLIINIANVNTTIGNQITNVQIDLTNQNSNINNTIINIDINLSNVNSTLGTLLTNINLDIININNNISNLYTFTENNFLNLGNNINNSFISITNNIIAINQTISTLVIGLDGKITIVNATITTMFTEMNSQFIVVQSTLDFSFAFLNQTIVQIGNNITNNQIALNNLIIQRANDIDNSIIQIQTLINLLNSTVANESLVVQTLVNIIGSNITENHVIINNLINLLGNNITENNINLVSLIELVGNNITTNHFVIQTLIDYVSNNITDNHLEFLTNINLINNTIGQNQIELINRLLFINNSINEMALDLTNQIILVNNTIYSAILDVSVSIDFNSDNILGNISLTYQQNDFLTNLYRTTMFSQLLNWSGVAFNYSLMEDRIDVWEFVNKFRDDAGIVFLRYKGLIDNLTVSAQNTIEQYLPKEGVEYRVWSIKDRKYLDEWQPLPENRTVDFGFYEADVPYDPEPMVSDFTVIIAFIIIIAVVSMAVVIAWAYMKSSSEEVPEDTKKRHKRKRKAFIDERKGFYDHT